MFLRVWLLFFVFVTASAHAAQPQIIRRFGRDGEPRQLIEGRDGALYGTGYKKIIRLTPNGGYRVLHEIAQDWPGGLVAAEDGHLYGTEFVNGDSVLFRLSYSGRIEYLHEFQRITPDRPVWAHSLVIGRDGAIYGLASSYYLEGPSTFFRATLDGDVTTIATFEGTPFQEPRTLVNAHDGGFLAFARVRNPDPFRRPTTVVRISHDGSVTGAVAGNASVGDKFQILPHTDGNYYLVGYSFSRLSPAGQLTPLHGPSISGGNQPVFLGLDGFFYVGRSMPEKTGGASEILRMDRAGGFSAVARNLRTPLLVPRILTQTHTGDFYGAGSGHHYECSAFRWRPPNRPVVNLGPYARPDFARPPAPGRSITIPVLRNDMDVNGDTLTITEISAPAHGNATVDRSGKRIIYTAPVGEPVATDEFTYAVSDGQGGRGIGRVSLRPNTRGNFTALLPNADWRTDGRLAVHISAYGGLTGRLWLGGLCWKFAGVVDGDNRFTISIRNSGTWKNAEITLQVLARGGTSFIEATVAVEGETIEQTLTKPNAAAARAAAGSYTFVIPAKPEWLTLGPIYSEAHGATVEHPLRRAAGDGIGHCRVRPNGSAIAIGRLPDGEPFTADYWMDEAGRLQVFSTLYRLPNMEPEPMRGWLRGLMHFRDVAGKSDIDGNLLWTIILRGAGGDHAPLDREAVSILASRYTPGTTLESAFPGLLAARIANVTAAPSGTARASGNFLMGNSPLQLNGTLNPSSGAIRGHLGNSSAWTQWSGVVFPKQNTIFGQFRRYTRIIWGSPPVGSGALRLTAQ